MTLTVVLRSIENVTQTKCLTCDCEIILSVFYQPDMSAGMLFECSRYSSTTFYATLKRLADNGVVVAHTDPKDRRSNVYRLNEPFQKAIEAVMVTERDAPSKLNHS